MPDPIVARNEEMDFNHLIYPPLPPVPPGPHAPPKCVSGVDYPVSHKPVREADKST